MWGVRPLFETGGEPTPWASATVHLAMIAQHAMKAGLAGDVDLRRPRRHDPRRRRLGEARFIANRDDLGSFGLAQRMRWRRKGSQPILSGR